MIKDFYVFNPLFFSFYLNRDVSSKIILSHEMKQATFANLPLKTRNRANYIKLIRNRKTPTKMNKSSENPN